MAVDGETVAAAFVDEFEATVFVVDGGVEAAGCVVFEDHVTGEATAKGRYVAAQLVDGGLGVGLEQDERDLKLVAVAVEAFAVGSGVLGVGVWSLGAFGGLGAFGELDGGRGVGAGVFTDDGDAA